MGKRGIFNGSDDELKKITPQICRKEPGNWEIMRKTWSFSHFGQTLAKILNVWEWGRSPNLIFLSSLSSSTHPRQSHRLDAWCLGVDSFRRLRRVKLFPTCSIHQETFTPSVLQCPRNRCELLPVPRNWLVQKMMDISNSFSHKQSSEISLFGFGRTSNISNPTMRRDSQQDFKDNEFVDDNGQF